MRKTAAIEAFAALAQETRLDIFRLLVRAGEPGLSAGQIGDALGVSAPTLSFHLKELKAAAIVACRREGRSLIYSPNFGTVGELLEYLSEDCCQGIPACTASSAPVAK